MTYQEKLQRVQDEVNYVIRGKQDVVCRVLAAMVGGGHILMEDIPGVGKTTLATTFARVLSLKYHRVQFTPDVLPSDILGFSMYNRKTEEFHFREGSVFCNLFLADELNRTSPKTQSALLEVMEERQASVEGDEKTAGAVHCHCDSESNRFFRDTDASGISIRPFYGQSVHGLSGTWGCGGTAARRSLEAGGDA